MPSGIKCFLLANILNQSGSTSDQAVELSLTVTGPRKTQYVPYKNNHKAHVVPCNTWFYNKYKKAGWDNKAKQKQHWDHASCKIKMQRLIRRTKSKALLHQTYDTIKQCMPVQLVSAKQLQCKKVVQKCKQKDVLWCAQKSFIAITKKTQQIQWAVKTKLPKPLSYRKCKDSVAYFTSPVLKM